MDQITHWLIKALIATHHDKIGLLEHFQALLQAAREGGDDALESQLAEWEGIVAEAVQGDIESLTGRFGATDSE